MKTTTAAFALALALTWCGWPGHSGCGGDIHIYISIYISVYINGRTSFRRRSFWHPKIVENRQRTSSNIRITMQNCCHCLSLCFVVFCLAFDFVCVGCGVRGVGCWVCVI